VLGLALSFICGIATYSLLPFFPVSLTIIFIMAVPLLYRFYKERALIIVIVFFLGLLNSLIRHESPREIELPNEEVMLTATIVDVPQISGGVLRLTADDLKIKGREIDGKVRLSLRLKEGEQYLMPLSGERIVTSVRLRNPVIFRNPGVYTYDPRRRGTVASGNVSSFSIMGSAGGLRDAINRERQRLGWMIDKSLSPESASLIKAIIPGLKRGISQEMREDFSRTGLAHLLSISGTHFGLLAFMLFKVVRMLIRLLPTRALNRLTLYVTPTQIAILLTMPFLMLYAGISGASIPTIRSLIMITIYMTALFVGRKDQWLNSLSIAGVIILLWNPSALFETSFVLSFVAVLSIGLVLERMNPSMEGIDGLGERIVNRLRTAFIITLSAVLGTAPFAILFFKQFSLISPLTNLLITPLICFMILPLGFLSCSMALLLNTPLLPLHRLIDLVTGFAINSVDLLSDIPYAGIHLHNPPFLLIMLYYLCMVIIIMRKDRWRYLPLCGVVILFLLRPYIRDYDVKVTFLDVGQGDSAVVELPDRRVMLIDGGSEGADAGRWAVAPYLWSKGIRDIDILVLTHPHYDHYGGLLYILDHMKAREVWLNGRYAEGSEVFYEKLIKKGIHYRILKRGDAFVGGDYKIIVMHPYDAFYANSDRGTFSDENNDSLVLKVEAGGLSVLFTGDIESEAEEDIAHLDEWLRSEIIKVPHHGGRTSSTEALLTAVKPDVAVISVGRYNSFGHPHKETIDRYRQKGIRVYRTDQDGAIIITMRDGRYTVKTYEDYQFKRALSIYDEMNNLRLLL